MWRRNDHWGNGGFVLIRRVEDYQLRVVDDFVAQRHLAAVTNRRWDSSTAQLFGKIFPSNRGKFMAEPEPDRTVIPLQSGTDDGAFAVYGHGTAETLVAWQIETDLYC